MARRPRPSSPDGIELSELPPWSGDPTTVRRTGYTPPRTFATPSLATTAAIRRSTSSLTTSVAEATPPRGGAHARARAGGAQSVPQFDVITAQIQRALGALHDAGVSDIEPDDDFSDGEARADAEAAFRGVLDAATVDVDELRRLIWAHGVPRRPWVRALAWKLLCGVLPPDRADWGAELAARRAQYWALVSEHSCEPGAAGTDGDGDHPLCVEDDSRWRAHFADARLRDDITRDAKRALADVDEFAPQRPALARLLFVHAKVTHTTYRQGMHELAAPLLAVFADAPFADIGDAEADAYHAFASIMREMTPVYDDAALRRHLRELRALLRIKDPGLESHLANAGVDLRFFALRWLRLWLAHEMSFNSLLAVWDSLLAAERRLFWLRYVAVAMLIRIRDQLLAADFAGCMTLLLRYPPCDIPELLRIADRLRTSRVVLVRRSSR